MIKIIFITLMSISYYNNDKEFLFVNPTESIRNKFNINSSIKNELEIINGEENITIKNYEHFLKFINLNYDKCSNNAKGKIKVYFLKDKESFIKNMDSIYVYLIFENIGNDYFLIPRKLIYNQYIPLKIFLFDTNGDRVINEYNGCTLGRFPIINKIDDFLRLEPGNIYGEKIILNDIAPYNFKFEKDGKYRVGGMFCYYANSFIKDNKLRKQMSNIWSGCTIIRPVDIDITPY